MLIDKGGPAHAWPIGGGWQEGNGPAALAMTNSGETFTQLAPAVVA
jgi:hypothetical protein